jgi:hypothetical protein
MRNNLPSVSKYGFAYFALIEERKMFFIKNVMEPGFML